MTKRLSETPAEIAEDLNDLTGKDLLQITDEKGRKISAKITPEQAASQISWIADLTNKSLRSLLAS